MIAALARLAAVALLASMALPAWLDGNMAQALFILSFAGAALIGVLLHGMTRPLVGFETVLLLILAASGAIALTPLLILQMQGAECSARPAALTYVTMIAAAALILSLILQRRARAVLAVTHPDARAPLSVWLLLGLAAGLALFLGLAWLQIAQAACGPLPDGRGMVLIYAAPFVTLGAAAYVNMAVLHRRRDRI